MDGQHKKIGMAITILGVLLFIAGDILGIIATLLLVAGSSIVKNVFGAIQDVILYRLGAYRGQAISKLIVKKVAARIIPAIPVLTATWLLSVYQHNHPKIAAVAQVATAKKPKPTFRAKIPETIMKQA